jgi:hypothetical protein
MKTAYGSSRKIIYAKEDIAARADASIAHIKKVEKSKEKSEE